MEDFFKIEVTNLPLFVSMIFVFACFFGFILWIFLPFIGRKFYPKKMYLKLMNDKKSLIDFESRIASNIHAVICTIAVLYYYFTTPEYHVEHNMYHPRFGVALIACYTCGYMLNDFFYMIYNRKFYKEFWVFILHHILSFLSAFAIVYRADIQLGFMCLESVEGTGFFINNITILPLLGLRKSKIFMLNAVCIIFAWIFFRFIVQFYLIYIQWLNWETYKLEPIWFLSYLIFLQCFFWYIDIMWFIAIIKGFLKVLKGQKIDKKEEKKE